MSTLFDKLIGKTITKLTVSEDGIYLEAWMGEESLAWIVEGDCCSQSWFNDILGLEALLNSPIQSIEYVDLPDLENGDDEGYGDRTQVYGHKFKTLKGYAEIIFRNHSNGYYGGWCEEVVLPQNLKDPIKWINVTEDWTANANS